jgi:transposase
MAPLKSWFERESAMSGCQQDDLFGEDPDLPAADEGQPAAAPGVARVLLPNRHQLELRPSDLDALLVPEHRARLVWAWVERMDLTKMYAAIGAVEGGRGRTPIAPEILLGLWLYATIEGVGSARAIARLTQAHDAYRWICGGVGVNYHTLSDFRVAHGAALDDLLTESVALLTAEGVVTLKRVAQDGMRVRASAGAASFRREARLEQYHQEAREQVERLKQQIDADPGAATRRQRAARARVARERQERLERALERLPEMAAIKARQGKDEESARVSSTDPEASNMKMADGGYRPAYNAQFAADTDSQVVVGVEAVTTGSDRAELIPMLEQIAARCGRCPEEYLADGGFNAHAQIEQTQGRTTVYRPVPQSKKADIDPHVPKDKDSKPVAEWRERMGSDHAKAVYPQRAATIECVNAIARERGLTRLRVRGTAKVRCVLLLHALAHNLMRTSTLAPQILAWGEGASRAAAMTS